MIFSQGEITLEATAPECVSSLIFAETPQALEKHIIARLWKTGLKAGRIAAYETFARDISLPMFRQQDGFLGCIMSRDGDAGLVLTFWRDQEAVDVLARSPSYKATVERILAADVLAGEQSTEVTQVHLLALDQIVDPL